MSFHIALQSGNANQVSSIYILSFHTKQSLPRILPTLQHSKLYRQARQAVQPWPATSCHFLSKGAPNENLQKKNIKSWLEHRNSYGHVFSLKIEASMNPLLYKLSNFQVLQSETSSGSSKVTFFQGQKKRDLPNGESTKKVTLKETGGQLLMWSLFSDPRLDSNQIQSCHLPVRQRHTCHREISWLQVKHRWSQGSESFTSGYTYRSFFASFHTPENPWFSERKTRQFPVRIQKLVRGELL